MSTFTPTLSSASARSVSAQRQPPTPPAIGDSAPQLRPHFNLHELCTYPAHLSDHSADFLDVCPSHSRRSPPPERQPSSSPPGTPPWAGRSGPPPASSLPPQASPQPGAPRRPHKLQPRPLQRSLIGEPPPPNRAAIGSATLVSHSSPLPQNGFLTSRYLSRVVPLPSLAAGEPDVATAATTCAMASPLPCFQFWAASLARIGPTDP
jgi:hypothetical protein